MPQRWETQEDGSIVVTIEDKFIKCVNYSVDLSQIMNAMDIVRDQIKEFIEMEVARDNTPFEIKIGRNDGDFESNQFSIIRHNLA